MKIPFLTKRAKYGTYDYLEYLQYTTGHLITSQRQFFKLKKIMKQQQLATYFQPILNLQDGSCLGYEVLNRPPFCPLFPHTDAFYDYIGGTNQVFAFEQFCRELSFKRYREALDYSPSAAQGAVFINVHPDVLGDTNYRSGETLRHLFHYGLKPEQIVFELTEKQAVEDYEAFENVLSNYRDQGFRIAIDDAGSGYNSLKSIVSLKPEFIKLDKSLVRHVDSRPDQQRVVKLLQEFALESGTHIIAEGIERTEELLFLRRHHIQFGQGYALGKPATSLKYQWIAEWCTDVSDQYEA